MTFAKTFRPGDRVELNGIRGTFRRLSFGQQAIVEWDKPGNPGGVDYNRLSHAPVTVIGTIPTLAPRTVPTVCPDCGAPVDIEDEALKIDPARPGEWTTARVAFCCGCEWMMQLS